jgi:hypothetical protein
MSRMGTLHIRLLEYCRAYREGRCPLLQRRA